MPSPQAIVTRFFMQRLFKPWLMAGDDMLAVRKRFARLSVPRWSVPAAIEPVSAFGVPSQWLKPPGADPERVLYYLHGGGFVACSPATHWRMVAQIARRAGMHALLPDYRLAPEHPFPAPLDDALAGYRFLLASGVRPERIVIAGDSAGGALTLGMLLSLRDAGEPLPAAAVCVSPATDATHTSQSFTTLAREEAMLTPAFCRQVVQVYLRDVDPRHPIASPLFADLRGLPPLLIHVGTHELLLDDATSFAERARLCELEVTLKVWEGMWHVFHIVEVPEARKAIAEIAAFARAHTGG